MKTKYKAVYTVIDDYNRITSHSIDDYSTERLLDKIESLYNHHLDEVTLYGFILQVDNCEVVDHFSYRF